MKTNNHNITDNNAMCKHVKRSQLRQTLTRMIRARRRHIPIKTQQLQLAGDPEEEDEEKEEEEQEEEEDEESEE